jgi:hypothetical protein
MIAHAGLSEAERWAIFTLAYIIEYGLDKYPLRFSDSSLTRSIALFNAGVTLEVESDNGGYVARMEMGPSRDQDG